MYMEPLGERRRSSKEKVQQIEYLLSLGTPKIQVARRLGYSRTLVDRVARGAHPHQLPPSQWLLAYRALPPQTFVCEHTTSLETVRQIESHLASGVSMNRITRLLGVSLKVVQHVRDGVHPRQSFSEIAMQAHRLRMEEAEVAVVPSSAHSAETVARVKELLSDGDHTQIGVARELGIWIKSVRRIAKGTHIQQLSTIGQQLRAPQLQRCKGFNSAKAPSRRRIARLCAEIRRTWTQEEREARWCGPSGWTPPHCEVSAA